MDSKKHFKLLGDLLSFLDHGNVRIFLIVVLALYSALIVPRLDTFVTSIFAHPLMKLFGLLLIILLSHKDVTLALLLAIAYVTSTVVLTRSLEHMTNDQNKDDDEDNTDDKKEEHHEDVDHNDHENNSLEQEKDQNNVEEEKDNVETFLNLESNAEVLGYNAPVNCVNNCDSMGSLSSPCKGVGTFTNEMNAQGLNCPVGNPGNTFADF